ncbi:MAG: 4Fe-4S binding protein [Desulfarculaceae bacterium]|nr:4Fe-4S binding protein [Desulfarculaceae bacterium]MCF8072654.1 4Fe-4S binding protein [Desulfarculaceae bacterium]MCF8102533.1 4Fe-4S binding protein [Desulfarculaceae bacterium]MCF8116442.1 4Fe-4S binding protein [Desulfarculaceae bacterium]
MPLQYLKDVTTLRANPELCLGCGLCLEVCPHGVLELRDQRVAVARQDDCMECGACMINCPAGALHVQAGVGCAQAVINSALGRTGDSCCCTIEPRDAQALPQADIGLAPPPKRKRPGCC